MSMTETTIPHIDLFNVARLTGMGTIWQVVADMNCEDFYVHVSSGPGAGSLRQGDPVAFVASTMTEAVAYALARIEIEVADEGSPEVRVLTGAVAEGTGRLVRAARAAQIDVSVGR